MRDRGPVRDDGEQTCWVSGADFSRYAEADLDRWRQVIGQRVQPVDPRWGSGRVESVSWGSCCEHVPATVQIKIRFDGDWAVVFCSESWSRHHLKICVPQEVEHVIETCLDPSRSPEEQAECLVRHSATLRERHDREVLDRVAQRRQRNTETSS